MAKSQRIVLVDSSALIHRAFHALPPLQTKTGELVNAVYGFTATLLKVLADLKPTYIAATFDSREKTFRHQEYAEYKATRLAAPPEIYEQIPRTKEVLEAFSIPIFEVEGFEADDLIATLTKQAQEKGLEVYIVTGDLDTLQLVGEKTKVFTLKRGLQETIIYDENEVFKRLGIKPSQVVDFKALKGDASDNIPGLPGIGEKTASWLIAQFGSLENLYQALEKNTALAKKLPQKLKENLIKNKDQAFFCKKLVALRDDVPIKLNLEQCYLHQYDKNQVFKLFQELGFKSLLKRLPPTQEEKITQGKLFAEGNQMIRAKTTEDSLIHHPGVHYMIIQQEEELKKLIQTIKEKGFFSLDTETTSREPKQAQLVGISFSFTEKEAWYLPLGHKGETEDSKTKLHNLDLKKSLVQLKPLFEDPQIKKYGHNIKYDMVVLLNYGILLKGVDFDSMIASYLLHPNTRAYDLDSVAFSELGLQTLPLEALIGQGRHQRKIEEVEIEKLGIYSCEDADIALRLRNHFEKELKEEKLRRLFYEIEMPLVSVLAKMEDRGVKLDIPFLEKMASELSRKIFELEKKIYEVVGYQFNLNSPQQLSRVLFQVLQLPKDEVRRTKTGISTAAGELEKLKGTHPVIDYILQYREYMKLKTTYVDILPTLVNLKTNRLHTSFNQTITATGRLSSSNPNLQNIPLRGDYGGQIRQAFIAEPGFRILTADYSQIELRIIASLSQDKRMLAAFEADEDIHAATAAEILGVPLEKVTKEMRRLAKTINFGIIYGMSSYGLAQALGISQEEARDYIEKYFNLHYGLKNYIEESIAQAREKGYAETVFGRRRPIPEINSSVFNVRAAGERMAINMPIQGTAADLIKLAMIKIDQELPKISKKAKMILQVHDELVFEVPEEEIKKVAKLVKEIMENCYSFKVPLKVDLAVGKNWGQLSPLEV